MTPRFPHRRLFRLPWRTASQIGAEVDEELAFHLDMRAAELERGGLAPEAARARAREEFGDVDAARRSLCDSDAREERVRRRVEGWEGLGRDLRFAARSLGRSRGFAAAAVLTLALGIGASTAMFSVVDGVLLRPLPVAEQDEIVVSWSRHPHRGEFFSHIPWRPAMLEEYGATGKAFASLGGMDYNGAWPYVMRDRGVPVTLTGSWVTGGFFGTLGVVPALGRMLQPGDDRWGAEPALVIGHGAWRRLFGGDPAVVGRRLEWMGKSYVVVGVAPPGFALPHGAEFWAAFGPVVTPDAPPHQQPMVDLVGRLRDGVTPEQAHAELDAYLASTEAQRPAPYRGMRAVVTPLPTLVTGEVRPAILVLSAAVALVLLIAGVNVAGLLLVRGAARVRELAVRSALGAGRARIARQLLTESALLAVLGGALGVLLAAVAVRGLVALAPPELPRLDSVRVDARVLAFALAVSLGAALLFGLASALWLARSDLSGWLRGGDRTRPGGAGMRRVRQVLVVGQMGLALMVLAAAGLLVRSLAEMQRVELGFDGEKLLVVQTGSAEANHRSREEMLAMVDGWLARAREIPGVRAATPLSAAPFAGTGGIDALFAAEGQSADAQATNPWLNMELVDAGYFQALGIPLLRGRAFTEADRDDAPPVAVVSEAVARRAWPGQDPIGRRIKLGDLASPMPWHTVVGVVAETRYRELLTPRPSLYLPFRQFGGPVPTRMALRVEGDPAAVVPALRAALAETSPGVVLTDARTMEEHLGEPLARPRFSAVVLALFAAAAVALAAVGIYGVMAAFVRQRSHEIGVRVALGARPADIRRLVLGQGLRLAAAGAVLGTLGALAGTRALASVLFRVSPTDPATFGTVAALLIGVALAACYLPARRAARVDPTVTLRE